MTIRQAFARFWPLTPRIDVMPAPPPVADPGPDGLDAFGSEEATDHIPTKAAEPLETRAPAVSPRRAGGALPWVSVALVAVVAAAGLGYQQWRGLRTATGSLTIETSPSGMNVVIAGKDLGRTPVRLDLAPGEYDVQLGAADRGRTVKVSVAARTSTVQHVEMPAAVSAVVATTGGLRIDTEPGHLTVLVDGIPRGVSPLSLEGIALGEHAISVRTDRGLVHRTVQVQPNEVLALVLSAGPAAAEAGSVSAGWLSLTSTAPLQLREGGKIIGTTESDRVMLPVGEHTIEITNAALGFRAERKVRVVAGKTTASRIDLPNGSLSINAQPWAEVWVDGERIGETPIGNLTRAIGTHEVVFRHPDLGERRESVVISLERPARIGVDLRKK